MRSCVSSLISWFCSLSLVEAKIERPKPIAQDKPADGMSSHPSATRPVYAVEREYYDVPPLMPRRVAQLWRRLAARGRKVFQAALRQSTMPWRLHWRQLSHGPRAARLPGTAARGPLQRLDPSNAWTSKAKLLLPTKIILLYRLGPRPCLWFPLGRSPEQ